MPSSKAGSFNAYFEFAQRNEKPATEPTTSGPTSLLAFLNEKPSSGIPLSELAESSNLTAADFRNALQRLVDSRFIEVLGSPMAETVKLTTKGEEVAKLL